MADSRGGGAREELAVAALLLNFRGAAMTLQCVRDLLAVEDVILTIVVIDNASGSEDVRMLQDGVAALQCGAHTVHVLPQSVNLGFSGGMNKGIEFAAQHGVPFVLVLNNDMRLPKGFVRPLVDVLHHDRAVGAVGPTVVSPDGTVWAEGGELGFAPNGLRLLGHGQEPTAASSGPVEVGFLTGACMMMRTESAKSVGGFNDAYFMYWEDVELCAKLRSSGLGVVWLPWIRVEHLGGQSSGGGRSPLRKFMMACNAIRYLKARGTIKAWAGWLCFDLLLWPITFAMGPRAALAKMRGTMAGLLGHAASAADVDRYVR